MKLDKNQVSAIANKVFTELNKPYKDKYGELYNKNGYVKNPIIVKLTLEDKKLIEEYRKVSLKINAKYQKPGLADIIQASTIQLENNIKGRVSQEITKKQNELLNNLLPKVTRDQIEDEIFLSIIEGDIKVENLIAKLVKQFK